MALPKGWIETTLGEVTVDFETTDPTAQPNKTFRYIDIGSFDAATSTLADVKTIAGSEAPSRARRVVRNGDVLLSTVRTYLKKQAIVPEALDGEVASTGIAVLRPARGINSNYLLYWLRTPEFVSSVSTQQDGTLYPAVTDKKVASERIPLPPYAEQKRIAAKLDALSARTARARTDLARTRKLAERYKQAVLDEAFEGGWPEIELDDLIKDIRGGKNLRCIEQPPGENEIGVVKVSAVTYGHFRPEESKTLPAGYQPPEDTRIEQGDFLFSRANTVELVGATAIVEHAPGNLYLSDKILRIRFRKPIEQWVYWALRRTKGKADLRAASSGNQQSMRNISQKNLARIAIPLPSLDEQREIVRRIEAAFARVDAAVAEAEKALALCERLDEAILAKAFRGELVPQDLDDEPADKLLERIRAERADKPKEKRRGRNIIRKAVGPERARDAHRKLLPGHRLILRRGSKQTTGNTAPADQSAPPSEPDGGLEATFARMPPGGFSFEDLLEISTLSFEDLRDAVMERLRDPSSGFEQYYDPSQRRMLFKKTG